MKKIILICFLFCMAMAQQSFARNVVVKDVPESISDSDLLEWVLVLVQRRSTAEIDKDALVVASKSAAANAYAEKLETFKTANNLNKSK